ncbi:hypothetical protein [Streptomyces sp. CC224B]|uniref:hypothetical protein n=1 Tax=Streptomyces sp. CC224B TaxID=3044571 RepID=UPI0024A9FEAB|nr:hypothetical protein [Streptomyces sp. CC224B]
MSPRPQQRAPKGRDRDRGDRRAVVDVLLARAHRGVLTPAEGALLAEHVREEQRLADETRRAMAGTAQALDRHREAADAAIVEAEQRATDAEGKLSQSETLGHRLLQRAERAEEQLAHVQAERDRLARDVDATTREAYTERRQHRQALAEQRARVDQVLARVRNAQSLGDVLAAVAEHDGLSPAAARAHGRMLDRADTTEARLAEQQREHDIALATERRRTEGWKAHTREAERQAGRYRIAWLAARRDRYADRAAMAAELPAVQAVERVRALATDMREWCSPHGIARDYAEHIEQALADHQHQEQHA